MHLFNHACPLEAPSNSRPKNLCRGDVAEITRFSGTKKDTAELPKTLKSDNKTSLKGIRLAPLRAYFKVRKAQTGEVRNAEKKTDEEK